MMQIRKTQNYHYVIGECYKSDPVFCEQYSTIAPDTVENCVNHSVSVLISDGPKLKMYALIKNNELFGYFTTFEGKIMTGFFILPKFRTKENVIKFWRIVKSKFKKDIYCSLYWKNTRAIKFMKRKGFKEVSRNGSSLVFKL